MARILVVDDDQFVRSSLARCIGDMGHEVLGAASLADGAELAATGVDVVYLDLHLPDGDGQEMIDSLASAPGAPEIIVITGVGNNYGAEGVLSRGAWEYITKPASPSLIRESLVAALEYRASRTGRSDPPPLDDCGMIGSSPPMIRVKEALVRAAQSEANVLLLGETGVGKERAAHAIHVNSRRVRGPFVVVDCSNLTESIVESVLYGHVRGAFTGAHADRRGLVAEADGGTLFLDEVGELPLSLQKSFLRVLQEKRFRPVGGPREQESDFRLVAATNRDLDTLAQTGAFRSDLLFRLRTVEITLPPLRERGDDLEELARAFAEKACARSGRPAKKLSKSLLKTMRDYGWPGNVREMTNTMEAAVIEAGQDPVLYPKHLPGAMRVSSLDKGGRRRGALPPRPPERIEISWNGLPYEDYKAIRDRSYFEQLMEACDGDMVAAQRLSGLSIASIYRHLASAGLTAKGRKRR